MTHHRRTFMLIASLAITAIIVGAMSALAALRTVDALSAPAHDEDCPLITTPTDDPTLTAVTQARLQAQRTFALYEFDGVSDEPRVVGFLDPGDLFCLAERDLDRGMTITEGGTVVPVGIIRTPEHPEGVYSGITAMIPTLHFDSDEDGTRHRIIPVRSGQWVNRPSDSPALPTLAALAASLGYGTESQEVPALDADEAQALH